MRRFKYLLPLLLVCLLLLSGCKQEPVFEKNSEIPYVRYLYDLHNTNSGEPLRNLTQTGAAMHGGDTKALSYRAQTLTPEEGVTLSADSSLGTVILRSPEEVEELLQKPLERLDPENNPGLLAHDLIRLEEQTKALTFDEAFFAESDLLVVDICCYYALTLPARPEEFKTRDGDVWLNVRYGYRDAVTGSHYGTLILIPVPKGSRHVEASYEFMKSWE